MDTLKSFPELNVGKLVEWVEVRADCAGEEDWVLRNDGQAGAQVMKFDSRDVDSIDDNTAFSGFEESEERERQG